ARHLIEMKVDSRLQRGEREFVAAQCAKERFALKRGNESLFSNDDSCLRAAEQLVATKANEIGAGLERFGRRGFMVMQTDLFGRKHRTASKILHERDALFARKCGKFPGRR